MIWAVSLAVVAALLVVARVVIRSRAKDAPGNQTVAVAFAPPREVTPATAAAILREVDNRLGIPAEILDLAREGVWQLGARDANRDGTKKVWFVTRRTQREPKLRPVPQEVYRTLFPAGYAGDEATLDGSTSIAQGFAGAVGEAEREVVKRGWVTTSQSPWTISLDLLGGLVAALAILPIAFGWFDLTWLPLQLVAGVAALVSRWIRPRRWQLTDKGRRLTDELAGLKQYMTLAEAERLRLLAAPETIMKRRVPNGAGEIAQVNERLLPYAVLFGILPQWAQVVQRSYADAGVAPGWLLLPGDPSGALALARLHRGRRPGRPRPGRRLRPRRGRRWRRRLRLRRVGRLRRRLVHRLQRRRVPRLRRRRLGRLRRRVRRWLRRRRGRRRGLTRRSNGSVGESRA